MNTPAQNAMCSPSANLVFSWTVRDLKTFALNQSVKFFFPANTKSDSLLGQIPKTCGWLQLCLGRHLCTCFAQTFLFSVVLIGLGLIWSCSGPQWCRTLVLSTQIVTLYLFYHTRWLRLSFCRSEVVLDLGDVEPTIVISNKRIHVLADVHLFFLFITLESFLYD